MNRYTAYKEKWINEAIQKHLDVAVEELKKIKGVLSIILIGGFGRGEGGVKIKGKKVIPTNDYDLYLITKEKVDEELINNIARKIEKRIGTSGYSLYEFSSKSFYFDIKAIPIKELKLLPTLIRYYEMKNASYVIYGEDLRGLMPDYKKENLPFSDGMRFLFNRISHITEWYSARYIKKKKVEDWEKEVLIDDTSKAYLSCCTALTLLANIYKPSYLARMRALKKVFKKKFPELNKKYPWLMRKIEFHTNLKLKPDFKKIKDINEMWFTARESILGVTKYFLNKFIKTDDFNKFGRVAPYYYVRPYLKEHIKNKYKINIPEVLMPFFVFLAQSALTTLWFYRIYKFRKKIYPKILLSYREPGIRVFSAVPFIVQTLNKDGSLNKEMMREGYNLLNNVYPLSFKLKYDLDTYDKLRKEYADAWRLYFFQKII